MFTYYIHTCVYIDKITHDSKSGLRQYPPDPNLMSTSQQVQFLRPPNVGMFDGLIKNAKKKHRIFPQKEDILIKFHQISTAMRHMSEKQNY